MSVVTKFLLVDSLINPIEDRDKIKCVSIYTDPRGVIKKITFNPNTTSHNDGEYEALGVRDVLGAILYSNFIDSQAKYIICMIGDKVYLKRIPTDYYDVVKENQETFLRPVKNYRDLLKLLKI